MCVSVGGCRRMCVVCGRERVFVGSLRQSLLHVCSFILCVGVCGCEGVRTSQGCAGGGGWVYFRMSPVPSLLLFHRGRDAFNIHKLSSHCMPEGSHCMPEGSHCSS